jgi:hypothetical protein
LARIDPGLTAFERFGQRRIVRLEESPAESIDAEATALACVDQRSSTQRNLKSLVVDDSS